MSEVKLDITKDEAYSIANHIDSTLMQTIRDDVDIDSMQWLRNMIHGYEKLCAYSGYIWLTDDVAGAVTYVERAGEE